MRKSTKALFIVIILFLCIYSFSFNYAFIKDREGLYFFKTSVDLYNSVLEINFSNFIDNYIHEFSHNYPPLVVFQTFPFYAILGVSQESAHISNLIHLMLISFFLYLIGEKLMDSRFGFITSLLFIASLLIFPFSDFIFSSLAMSSMYFGSLTFLFLSKFFKNRFYSILLGLFTGLGFLSGGAFVFFIMPALVLNTLFYILINRKKGLSILSRKQSINLGMFSILVLFFVSLWYPLRQTRISITSMIFSEGIISLFGGGFDTLLLLGFTLYSVYLPFKIHKTRAFWSWIYFSQIFSFLGLMIVSPLLILDYFPVFFPPIVLFFGLFIFDIFKFVKKWVSSLDNFEPRELIDLEKLPFPTYEELDLSQYSDKVIGMSFSRGCIGNCSFCEDKIFQGRYRTRNPKDVVDELKYHVEHNGISHFWFNDLAINGDNKKLEELCDLIIKEKLDIKWIALAIARKDTPKRLLHKLKKAGCYTLNYGIESGSNSVLKKMNKHNLFSAEDAERIMKWTREAGINVQPNFIVGFPGETESEFKETLEFIEKNKDNISGITNINTCLIPKNSPAGMYPERFGIIGGINENNQLEWETGQLDYSLRLERARKTKKLAQKLGYDIYFTNLSQQEPDNKLSLLSKKNNLIKFFKSYFSLKKFSLSFVLCPPWDFKMPHLGFGYLAAQIDKDKYDLDIYDLNIELYNLVDRKEKEYWKLDSYLKWREQNIHQFLFEKNNYLIKDFLDHASKKDLLCFSVNAANRNSTLDIIKKIKLLYPNCKIGVGGPNISKKHFLEDDMSNYVDFAFVGEGEEIINKIIQKIEKSEPLYDIDGVLVPQVPEKFGNTPIVKNLDSLSYPTFEGFPLDLYENKSLPILLSRGCIRRCAFCCDWKIGRQYRVRDPEKVFHEIQYHVQHNNINTFEFKDLLINGDIKALGSLCDYIIDSGINITWSAQGIIRKDMTLSLLKKMKRSGFVNITYGVESFSNNVLKNMRKGITQKIIHEVLQNTQKAGIEIQINIIVGFPGETEEDFKETYDYIKKNYSLISGVSSLLPLSIYGNSDLMVNPQTYGLEYPKNVDISSYLEGGAELFWEDETGLDFEIRKRRLEKIMNLLDRLKIPYPEYDFGALDIKSHIKKPINNVVFVD